MYNVTVPIEVARSIRRLQLCRGDIPGRWAGHIGSRLDHGLALVLRVFPRAQGLSGRYRIMRVQKSVVRTLGFVGLAALGAAQASAQTSVTVGGREIQVHGFVQQGFVFTDDNSFLTMGSSNGSGEMTDGAFNVSTKLNDKLRIGAQAYARNLGQFGNGHVELDWVFADYQLNDKIGFRGGKVKTQLGLINDTQDMEFLHT